MPDTSDDQLYRPAIWIRDKNAGNGPKEKGIRLEEILHQLRLVVDSIICRVLYIPGGWPWDFWTIKSTFLNTVISHQTGSSENHRFKSAGWGCGCRTKLLVSVRVTYPTWHVLFFFANAWWHWWFVMEKIEHLKVSAANIKLFNMFAHYIWKVHP